MTLLIRNVQLADGVRRFPERSDLFVSGAAISAIGSFPNKKADTVVDAAGYYLLPAFTDVHPETDHHFGFMEHPSQEEFLGQGVTALMLGQDGVSLAPATSASLAPLEEWTDLRRMNAGWRTPEEFLGSCARRSWGVHIGTMLGYRTLRRAVQRPELVPPLLAQGLAAGAFGLSSDENSFGSAELAKKEVQALAKVLDAAEGVWSVALPKDEAKGELALNFWLRVARDHGGLKIVLNTLPLGLPKARLEEFLGFLDQAPENVFSEVPVFPGTPEPLYSFLPRWAWRASLGETARLLEDEWTRSRILKELPRLNAGETWIAGTFRDESVAGMTLAQFAETRGLEEPEEALMFLMRSTGLRGLLLRETIGEAALHSALQTSRCLLGSRGVSVSPVRERTLARFAHSVRAFPQFLLESGTKKSLSLPLAVKKISALPAKLYGLEGRGELKEGFAADLVAYRDGQVKFTVVSGKIAWQDGSFRGIMNGRTLFHRIGKHVRA